MNDICSPLLLVMQSEDEALAVFTAVMKKQSLYFSEGSDHTRRQLEMLLAMLQVVDPRLHDQITFSPESRNLFVCYRWLLLLFKREVGFHQFSLVLETIYAAPLDSYELFVALALLEMHREHLLLIGHRFDLTLQVLLFDSTRPDGPVAVLLESGRKAQCCAASDAG